MNCVIRKPANRLRIPALRLLIITSPGGLTGHQYFRLFYYSNFLGKMVCRKAGIQVRYRPVGLSRSQGKLKACNRGYFRNFCVLSELSRLVRIYVFRRGKFGYQTLYLRFIYNVYSFIYNQISQTEKYQSSFDVSNFNRIRKTKEMP
jgi:hypothetical protein